jgi:diguanylate cyclase (GGDEF)-like protein
MLGRIGGDEFAALVPIVPLWHQIERVHDLLTDPFTTERGVEITPGISIGVVVREEFRAATLGEALHGADMAMYDAKRAGGGFVVYDPAVHSGLQVEQTPARRVRHHGHAA